jgi:recombinational DNA repair protein RecT
MARGCKKKDQWNKQNVHEMRKKLTKISPVITHTTGPQEMAKKDIYLREDRDRKEN